MPTDAVQNGLVLPTWATVTIVIAMLTVGFIVFIELFAMTFLLWVMKNLVQDIRERVDPLIAKTNTLLATANEVAQSVQARAEHIAEKTSETTDVVSDRVDKTTEILQGVVTTPIIQGAAVMEGIRHGVATWRTLRGRKRRGGYIEVVPTPAEPTPPGGQVEPGDDGAYQASEG